MSLRVCISIKHHIYHVYFISSYAFSPLIRIIIKSLNTEIIESSTIKVINSSIKALLKKNKTPSLIIFDPLIRGTFNRYSYQEISGSESFQSKNEEIPDEVYNRFYLGKFDNIPIFSSHNEFLKKRMIVCDFKEAFKMDCITNPEWFEDVLSVKVSAVSEEEAKERLEKNPENWKFADGIELNDNDALTLIKTSVWINISLSVDFHILDSDAILLGSVEK